MVIVIWAVRSIDSAFQLRKTTGVYKCCATAWLGKNRLRESAQRARFIGTKESMKTLVKLSALRAAELNNAAQCQAHTHMALHHFELAGEPAGNSETVKLESALKLSHLQSSSSWCRFGTVRMRKRISRSANETSSRNVKHHCLPRAGWAFVCPSLVDATWARAGEFRTKFGRRGYACLRHHHVFPLPASANLINWDDIFGANNIQAIKSSTVRR